MSVAALAAAATGIASTISLPATIAANAAAGAASGIASSLMSSPAAAPTAPQPLTTEASGPGRMESAYNSASSFGTFLFGERKSDADRIRESERDLRHDARHFDRQRQIAQRAEEAKQRTVDAMIARGQTGPALKEALRSRREHAKNTQRAARVATRLDRSAAAVGDTEAKLRIMGAAAKQADALVRTNAVLAENGSPMQLGATIARETERSSMQMELIDDAFDDAEEDSDDEDNVELEAEYEQAVQAALMAAHNRSTTRPAAAAQAIRRTAAAAAAAVEDEELNKRLERLRTP